MFCNTPVRSAPPKVLGRRDDHADSGTVFSRLTRANRGRRRRAGRPRRSPCRGSRPGAGGVDGHAPEHVTARLPPGQSVTAGATTAAALANACLTRRRSGSCATRPCSWTRVRSTTRTGATKPSGSPPGGFATRCTTASPPSRQRGRIALAGPDRPGSTLESKMPTAITVVKTPHPTGRPRGPGTAGPRGCRGQSPLDDTGRLQRRYAGLADASVVGSLEAQSGVTGEGADRPWSAHAQRGGSLSEAVRRARCIPQSGRWSASKRPREREGQSETFH